MAKVEPTVRVSGVFLKEVGIAKSTRARYQNSLPIISLAWSYNYLFSPYLRAFDFTPGEYIFLFQNRYPQYWGYDIVYVLSGLPSQYSSVGYGQGVVGQPEHHVGS